MEYRNMGATGLKVSELCLGAMTFGRESTEEESMKMLNRFVEAGGNFIDTADVYSQGLSETILGKWLKTQKRDDFVIATKVRFPMGEGANEVGLSRKHILSGIESSLKRLNTNYVDLYQVHMWDPNTPLEETLGTLDGLVKSGKVRYVGASNFAGYQLQKAVDLSQRMGWEAFTCLQPLYNLLDRSIEWEILPVCEEQGIGVIPWSPLRGGWLSGKYRRGMKAPLPNTRVDDATKQGWSEGWNVYDHEHTWKVIDNLLEVSNEVGKSPAQVALRWLLQRPCVTAPIIGARTLKHLEDNLGASGWAISAELMERLDHVSQMELVYPYNSLAGLKQPRK